MSPRPFIRTTGRSPLNWGSRRRLPHQPHAQHESIRRMKVRLGADEVEPAMEDVAGFEVGGGVPPGLPLQADDDAVVVVFHILVPGGGVLESPGAAAPFAGQIAPPLMAVPAQ